uniref:Insulin-degrading enzyme homolog n=1 Tax=Zeugodacus cucurbitae TaxID=28588 RepID=A0A0A1XNN6_ZEUCU
MRRLEQLAVVTLLAAVLLIDNAAANGQARTCYACEGINCQRTTYAKEQKCLNALDYCVTVFDKFTVVQKGCSLEVPIELRRRCDANTVECHKCNTDRCNNLGQQNYLCLQCDSSKDANCASAVSNVTPARCPSPTATNSYCYVKYDGGVTTRGCSTTLADQSSCYASANCMLCSPGELKGCNSVDFQPGTRALRL